jgi:dolichol-phosphate mannosyltransferase
VVHRPGKQGIGTAHRAGIAYAYEHAYDRLITLDADFSHQPSDLPRLLEAARDGVDVVVGSRWLKGDSLPGWNLYRRILTYLGHFLTGHLLRIPHDATGALRLYDLRRIPRALFDLCTAASYAFFFESAFILRQNGHRVHEIPIKLPARVLGSSKLTLTEAARSARYLLGLWSVSVRSPGAYRIPRLPDRLASDLSDDGWDRYWSARSQAPVNVVYDLVAGIYRRLVIKRNIERALRRYFPRNAMLLHAGCGSGETDVDLHGEYQISAIDISEAGLSRYAHNNPRASWIEQANIFDMPFDSESFDGVYSLGVVEHFTQEEIQLFLKQAMTVLKPGGTIVLFWPHRRASSVFVLHGLQALLHRMGRAKNSLHPEEISLIGSKREAREALDQAGLDLIRYSFGPSDGFVQAIVVGRKPSH